MYSQIFDIINKNKLKPLSMKDSTASHLYGFQKGCKELGLKYEKYNNHFLIKSPYDDSIIGGVSDMVSSFVSSFALRVCNDKVLTNKILKSNKIKVPKQFSFPASGIDDAIECFKKNNLKVVKPSNGAGGKGITVGINNEDELIKAFNFAVKSMKSNGRVLLEELITGFDARVIVVNGKFVCAVTRLPAHIIGDGKSTISELVELKNKIRANHPHHKSFPIILDDVHNKYSIPNNDELYFINNTSNIHQGGEAVDITEYISNDIKNLAIKASKSVHGLNVVGVDFQLKDLSDSESAHVLELNTSSNFSIHYFPYYGEKRNPALEILKDFIAIL